MTMWNDRFLQPPPNSSCRLINRDINLHELYHLLDEAVNLFSSQVFLSAECKIMHLIVRKFKLSYRTHIGYKKLQKLNRCIRLYEEFNYKELLASFLDFLPRKYEEDTYFPSRNMLDFFLVKTQGLGKLIARLFECSKEVFIHWSDKLKLGHNIGTSIIIIAVQSRIFIIFQYLLQCISQIYDKLIILREKIANIQYSWLPKDYVFPMTLQTWLDVDWVYAKSSMELSGKNNPLLSISLFDDDEVEFDKEYKIISDDEDLEIVNEYLNVMDDNDDMVEVVKKEIEDVNDQTKAALAQVIPDSNLNQNVIEVNEDIGEPFNKNAKIIEVTIKLEEIKTLDDADKFIKDSSHTYFRSLGMVRYNNLLSFVELQKSLTEGFKRKKKKKFLMEVKEKILELIQISTSVPE